MHILIFLVFTNKIKTKSYKQKQSKKVKAYPPFCEAVTEKGRPFWRLSLHFIKASKHIDFNLLYSLRKILELQKQKSIKNSFWITNSNVQIKLNQFFVRRKEFCDNRGLGFKGLWEGLRCIWGSLQQNGVVLGICWETSLPELATVSPLLELGFWFDSIRFSPKLFFFFSSFQREREKESYISEENGGADFKNVGFFQVCVRVESNGPS